MRLRVLGPHGGELPGCKSTCFLVDGKLALDAGALTSTLSLEELEGIDDVLLTHSHFDHVKDLPMLSDVLVGRRRTPVMIHGNRECIATLKANMFNGVLWPDFTAIPTRKAPLFQLRAFRAGATVEIGGYTVKTVEVSHPVESCGYLILDGKGRGLAMSGDTGPTQRFWDLVNDAPKVRTVLVECSFPSSMQELADISGHFTPATLARDLEKLHRDDVDIFLYHMKPAHLDELAEELAAMPRVRMLEREELFEL